MKRRTAILNIVYNLVLIELQRAMDMIKLLEIEVIITALIGKQLAIAPIDVEEIDSSWVLLSD